MDAAGDGGGGKALHRVPDHPRLFVDAGDGKARPVRQGEKAAVGGLAAPLGVKDRPGQGDEAPAVRLRQNGRDDRGSRRPVSVGLVEAFGWLHGVSLIPRCVDVLEYTTIFACGK